MKLLKETRIAKDVYRTNVEGNIGRGWPRRWFSNQTDEREGFMQGLMNQTVKQEKFVRIDNIYQRTYECY